MSTTTSNTQIKDNKTIPQTNLPPSSKRTHKKNYFDSAPDSFVIGPQIGPDFTGSGIKITIALPHKKNIETLTCTIIDIASPSSSKSVDSKAMHPIYRNYLFEFLDLDPGKRYKYIFTAEDKIEVDLEGGLTSDDCYFNTPSFSTEDRFAMLSCNNPFHSGPKASPFSMWERLLKTIKQNNNIRLLVQGGDQVYNDDIEVPCLKELKQNSSSKEAINNVTQKIIKNYQHYLGNLNIRRILACTPSVAMLDDHDITDGWGSRPESFTKEGTFKPEWKTFFEITYSAFEAYQAIKNPTQIKKTPLASTSTTFLDFGENRLYLLDLRKQKNTQDTKAPLLQPEHQNALLKSIQETPKHIQNIFVLSPVVPVRIDPKFEEALGAFAKLFFALRKVLRASNKTKPSRWKSALISLFDNLMLPDLSDDLDDGLGATINKPFLIELLKKLTDKANFHGVNTYLLSGDIHTGGISEIFVRKNDTMHIIPQIVSSPIGYEPMKKIAKDFTTAEGDYSIEVEEEGIEVTARNIFYNSNRNFALIQPSKLKKTHGIEFFFENMTHSIQCSAFFSHHIEKEASVVTIEDDIDIQKESA